MKRSFSRRFHFFVCVSLAIAFAYPYTALAQACEPWAGKVVSVQGTVEAQRAGATQWQPVALHDTYCPGDTIRVQDRSRADVSLVNQSVLRLSANTQITLEEVKEERTSVVGLLKGLAHFFSRRPRSLEVRTPYTVAGVRGTEFFIGVDDNKTSLTIYEGYVLASNEAGQLALTAGQSAVAEKGKAPVLRVVAHPRDAVQWALYYPPVLYLQADQLKSGIDWQRQVGTSMEYYLQGDIQKAFEAIKDVPDSIREPRFFAYRASLLLAVGRVDEANADIERALRLKPNDSDALSLQTIIAIVQNDTDKALSLAQQAVAAAPDSATAQIALSYAQQARFDLEGARASVQKAVELDPHNALAWARLAELQASFGDLSNALKAAMQAVKLEPNLARTQTVLGFAYLTQVKTDNAKAAFEKAITLDQADPLPRLGLGLAIIRNGDLAAGGRQIEIAASLDPNNSLIRSYLGKVYYEEKRGKLDEREFETAKQLDPNDPTPWFYSAIAKQTTNRPVEALHDMQKAIELNDNRAIYRSKLLLDSDLAARQSSQARIYNNLGFQQLALVEGWKSVNTDPTNFSAHRFLADSYAALPRHEIARVSELLQSQLLQPINITPIQPRLAESNLFLISAQGPAALSFTEFNPLFNRNGYAIQANGVAGNHDTFAGEGVLSGIAGKMSASVGYSYFKTDGFRENADQEDNIIDAFVQLELSPKTSIQTEFRYRDIERGDLALRFFEDEFLPTFRQRDEVTSVRLGFRHSFAPHSDLIGNGAYYHADRFTDVTLFVDPSVVDLPPPDIENLVTQPRTENAGNVELQYLYRSKPVNLVGGAGYFRIDVDESFSQIVTWPGETPPLLLFEDIQEDAQNIDHFNVYLYTYIHLLKHVTFTVGASGDFYHVDVPDNSERNQDENQFNPKFGVIWNPIPSTTLRGAVFRTLKRTLVTDQTLEPTQVAGFNQFYDEPNATSAWNYGAAVDQKFTRNIYGGVEFVYRDLDVPFFSQPVFPGPFVLMTAKWEEYLGRAYLNWTPHKWFALRIGYRYEKFKRDEDFNLNVFDVRTHRVPLGINFFHPTGIGVGLKATYINQSGEFERLDAPSGEFTSGDDQFWVVDLLINYRFPKRYGFLTFGVTNLLDESFNFFDIDLDNPSIQPRRMFIAQLSLSFP